jgi:hypothetical protein
LLHFRLEMGCLSEMGSSTALVPPASDAQRNATMHTDDWRYGERPGRHAVVTDSVLSSCAQSFDSGCQGCFFLLEAESEWTVLLLTEC